MFLLVLNVKKTAGEEGQYFLPVRRLRSGPERSCKNRKDFYKIWNPMGEG
jgi:hypothetical protein